MIRTVGVKQNTMRVITGTARGHRLETLPGEETRPTAERVKEGLFSAIQFDIEGRRVLDLFAGSGQLGIEALSRGAAECVFVDRNPKATDIIRRNLQAVGLYAGAHVLTTDALQFLERNRERFNLAFLDPPYASGLLPQALTLLAPQIDLGGTVICESDRDKAPDGVGGLWLRKMYRYGRVCIWLYRKENGTESPEGGDRL